MAEENQRCIARYQDLHQRVWLSVGQSRLAKRCGYLPRRKNINYDELAGMRSMVVEARDMGDVKYPWEAKHGPCKVILSQKFSRCDRTGEWTVALALGARFDAAYWIDAYQDSRGAGKVHHPDRFSQRVCVAHLMGRWCMGECKKSRPLRSLRDKDCWAFSSLCHLKHSGCVMLQILENDELEDGQQEEFAMASAAGIDVYWCKVEHPTAYGGRVVFYSRVQNSHEQLYARLVQPDALAAALAVSVTVLRREEVENDFVVLDNLGTGGFSAVLLMAEVKPERRLCAMKIVNKQPTRHYGRQPNLQQPAELAEREKNIYHEIWNTAEELDEDTTRCGHPFIVRLFFHCDWQEGRRFGVRGQGNNDRGLIMDQRGMCEFHIGLMLEYCPHGSLEAFANVEFNRSTLPPDFAWFVMLRRFLAEVLLALDYLHNIKDVVHRDVKMENILVVEGDGGPHVKISGFKFGKCIGSSTGVRTVSLAGTPYWAAPEMMNVAKTGRRLSLDPVSHKKLDVFSFGTLAFALAYGQPYLPEPHKGTNIPDEIGAPCAHPRCTGDKRELSFVTQDLAYSLHWEDENLVARKLSGAVAFSVPDVSAGLSWSVLRSMISDHRERRLEAFSLYRHGNLEALDAIINVLDDLTLKQECCRCDGCLTLATLEHRFPTNSGNTSLCRLIKGCVSNRAADRPATHVLRTHEFFTQSFEIDPPVDFAALLSMNI